MGAAGVIGVVLAASFLEGIWTWLFAAAISEVVGQAQPPAAVMMLVLGAAWLCARLTSVAGIAQERRRQLLALGGLGVALVAGTIQAGVLLPIQLVFGTPTPDMRAAGIILCLLIVYLWSRGLWLALRVTRRRVINHIVASASGLIGVLVFLPLTTVVQEAGLGAAVTSFTIGTTSLLMVQLTEAESHRFTRAQWTAVAAGMTVVLIVGAAGVAGAFSSGGLRVLADGTRVFGRTLSPITDAVLLSIGYVAHVLAMFVRWLGEMSGVDSEQIIRAMRRAEEARPRFEEATPEAPPDVLAIPVAIFVTTLVVAVIVSILLRLIRPLARQPDGLSTHRQRIFGDRPDRGRSLRSALGWLWPFGGSDEGVDPRELIRRQYRAFQILTAQAEIPRRKGQTPAEFERTVVGEVPATRDDVTDITSAYIVARYADDRTPLADPGSVARAVEGVGRALRVREIEGGRRGP